MSINPKTRTKIQEIKKKLKDRMENLQYKTDDEVIDDSIEYFYEQLKKNKAL